MKKLFVKDRKNRKQVKQLELERFVLKQISTNFNFLNLIKWNASNKVAYLPKNSSKTVLSNRCALTTHKKAFHKFSRFSRYVFLKAIKSGQISGIRKSVW